MVDRRVGMAVVCTTAVAMWTGCGDTRDPGALVSVLDAPPMSAVSSGPTVGLALVAAGLTQPVALKEPPDGS